MNRRFARILFPLAAGAAGLLTESPMLGENPAQFVLIVNKANKIETLSAAKLKVIYLRKMSRWPWGSDIVPIDLPDSSALRRSFAATILDSTSEKMAAYWIEQKVTGNVNPPMQAASVAAVKAAVASQPGAIAYIPAADMDDTVKLLKLE
jgi:ABC-type phosphate transport system substrate-binding protein